ncbi:alpha/beta fold hydrolase [Sphingosinicella microcystinivorans]|uniref:alpha/beta fold hydrolase n=1 Tax=Sphingosinicella microcystinivorans TaxID=335406 RepID=UPI0022F394FC|nr:alpha/beta hydrolase [Sphingosinicella microcystinivorans]WBX84177.1 alpha/beta hydrolase [Sphingosinicella microcystinivorans]
MRVDIGELRLFVEILGEKLAVRDGQVVEKPTIVFVHGGPAWDHLTLRVDLESLADVAQLVFYDHRGLGRSDVSTPEDWTLTQWAADLHNLIRTLGLEKPIIFGQSFGGMVTQRFALDYPEDYSAIILAATAARFNLPEVIETFRRLGGEELATIAHSFYTAADPAHRDRFLVDGFRFYTVRSPQIGVLSPFKPDVLDHFFSDAGDAHRFDYRAELQRIDAPVLVLGGEVDPVISAGAVRELAESFRPGVAELHIFDDCGHGPARDQPEAALALLRNFVAKAASGA